LFSLRADDVVQVIVALLLVANDAARREIEVVVEFENHGDKQRVKPRCRSRTAVVSLPLALT